MSTRSRNTLMGIVTVCIVFIYSNAKSSIDNVAGFFTLVLGENYPSQVIVKCPDSSQMPNTIQNQFGKNTIEISCPTRQ